MAPVYADRPFAIIHTPQYRLPAGQKPDLFDRLATDMAVVHNMMIRSLNSIYLQAPHIKPEDEIAFSNYMYQLWRFLHAHHTGEETHFFPSVEKITGEKDLMATNIAQHRSFHDGLDEFGDYAKECAAGGRKFDGQKVVAMIDSFGPGLIQHLNDEIPTLLGLRKYGEDMMAPAEKVFQAEAQEVISAMGLLTGLPWVTVIHDRYFEDSIHFSFPNDPIATAIFFVCRHITYWVHSDWWKFGATDRFGKMKPLYAVPETSD